MQVIFVLWLLYAVPAVLLCVPVVALSWSRVRWRFWELLIFVAPFGLWFWLVHLCPEVANHKGISNIGEPISFALAPPLLAGVRVFAAMRLKNDGPMFAVIIQILACAAAAAVYFFTPNLGGHI